MFTPFLRKARIESNVEKAEELLAAAEAGSKALLLETKKVMGHCKEGQDCLTPWREL